MFRETIKKELERRNWTPHRLTKESSVGRATVYEYLKGNREIETDSLEEICRVLDLRLKPPDPE